MGRFRYSGRGILLFIALVLLSAPVHAQFRKNPSWDRDFIIFMAGLILVFLVYALRTWSFIRPIWTGLREQSPWLSTSHIVLFLSCFLLAAKVLVGGLFAWPIPLMLFHLGMILLVPGVHRQRQLEPDGYRRRVIRNSLLSIATGFLLIPGFALFYFLTRALTAFIRD